jgi:hypothetical protein
MPILSAADAISPAIYRTRQFLFAPPFRWGTFLKLCLVAAITEGLGSNLRSSGSKGHRESNFPSGTTSFLHLSPSAVAACIAAIALAIVITLFIVYLVTRLRFAYFHCLTHNVREIRPGWELYRPQAKRFFLMNIGVGACFLLVIALLALPFVAGFWRFFQGLHNEGGPNWGLFISLILPLIPLVILLVVVGLLVDIVLRDWMLPHYALEDATASEAWHEVWMRIRNEKKQFFVYSVLRVISPIVAAIALAILFFIPALVSVGAVGAAEYAIHSAFATSTGSANAAGIALEVFIGLLAFAFAVLVGISFGGPLSTGLREYALLFYGSRYQPLENVMFPQTSPGAATV